MKKALFTTLLFNIFLLGSILMLPDFTSAQTTTPPEALDPTPEVPIDNVEAHDVKEVNLINPLYSKAIYIKVIDSCNFNFAGGACLNVRSGPGTDNPVVKQLRNGEVIQVDKLVMTPTGIWYRLTYEGQHLYYPERIEGDQYVAAPYVELIIENKPTSTWENGRANSNKRIVVDISDQSLTAYDGDEVYFQTVVSTGEELSPTEIGTYEVFKKMPSRYMQGPIPDSGLEDEYDLEGVPWNMYFSARGDVIHGAYWHNNFGNRHSHGCVNLAPYDAELLYRWAPLGTTVTIQE